MDEVEEAVEKAKREWEESFGKTQGHVRAISEFGLSSTSTSSSLPRLNGLAQDGLARLDSLISELDLLAPQLPSDQQIASARALFDSWTTLSSQLRLSLRNANLKAKNNMRKAAKEQRELLLGGGEESTIRRRNLQTKAGMMSAAENITESLRRSRQLMVQEVERSTNTLMTFEESTGVLKKAESEYKGHRSLLMRTRNLLSTMERQDVIYRLLLVVGFLCFSCAVLFVVSKRIGVLKLQRKITAALKTGMAGKGEFPHGLNEDGLNVPQSSENAVPKVEVPLDQVMHDEL